MRLHITCPDERCGEELTVDMDDGAIVSVTGCEHAEALEDDRRFARACARRADDEDNAKRMIARCECKHRLQEYLKEIDPVSVRAPTGDSPVDESALTLLVLDPKYHEARDPVGLWIASHRRQRQIVSEGEDRWQRAMRRLRWLPRSWRHWFMGY